MNDRRAVTNYYAALLTPVPGRELSLPPVRKYAQHLVKTFEVASWVMAARKNNSRLRCRATPATSEIA